MAEVVCRQCGGTGRAQDSLGKNAEQREFGRYLLAEMERMCERIELAMRGYLRGRNLRG